MHIAENQSLGGIMASLGVMPINPESSKAARLMRLNLIADYWEPLTKNIKIPQAWVRLHCNIEIKDNNLHILNYLKNADAYLEHLNKNRAQCWHNYGSNKIESSQIESLTGDYYIENGRSLTQLLEAVGVTQIWYVWGGMATVLRDSGVASEKLVPTGHKIVFQDIPVTKKCNAIFAADQKTFTLRSPLTKNCEKPIEKVEVPVAVIPPPAPVVIPPPVIAEVVPEKKPEPVLEPIPEPTPAVAPARVVEKEAFYYRRPEGFFAQGGLSQVTQSAPDVLNVSGFSEESQVSGARLGAGYWRNRLSAQTMFRTAINTVSGRDYRPSWFNALAGYGSEYKSLSNLTPYLMPLLGFEYYYNNSQIPGVRNLQSYLGANLGIEARFVLGTKIEIGGIYLLGFSKSVNKSFAQADLRYWLSDSDGLGFGYWSDTAKQRDSTFSESSSALELYYRKLFF